MSARAAQVLVLFALSTVWGLGANALREEPIPLRGPLGSPPTPEAGSDLPASPPEAALVAWESGAFFVDVRDAAAFEERRVAGALSLPAGDFATRYFDVVADLVGDVPLVVYGAEADSFAVRRVAQELRERGHTRVDLVVCGPEGLFAAGLGAAEGPEGGP